MKKKLTARSIAALKAKPKRAEYWDQILPGFGVRVGTNGAKRYFVKLRIAGKQRRFSIDPKLSLADARREARRLIASPPVVDTATGMTFAEAAALFVERWSKPRCRSWMRIDEILQRKFPSLMQKPVAQITRRDMAEAVAAIKAPMMANRSLATVRKLFSWLEQQGIITEHPCIRMPLPSKEIPRERVLTEDELRRIWHATDVLGPVGAPYYRLLMLTAQRRGETSRMRWSDISEGVWSLPARETKNGKAHTVYLSTRARALIAATPRFDGCPFVFSHDGVGPVANQARMKVLLDRASGVDAWVVHDIRRSVVSHLAGLGVAPHVLERVLNHQSGVISGVAKIYNRYTYAEECRAALQLWGDHLTRLVETDREQVEAD